jgi:hypothetical protein
MPTLGVLIVSVHGMNRLPQCLESVGWADAIMVLHVGGGEPAVGSNRSPSAVIRKARSATELEKMGREVKTDWVLRLWGEEEVGARLKEELHRVSKGSQGIPSAYRIPIRSRVLDRWVQGSLWGPSPARRFSSFVDDLSPEWWNLEQEKSAIFPEPLKGSIDDYTLEDLAGGFEQIHRVSDLWAEHLNATIHSSASMALRPFSVFFGSMWMNGFVSHGLAGLTFSTLAAYATLLSGAKAWESRNVSEKGKEQS